MAESDRPTSIPPFPMHYRASGVLLHVTSLPSPYGVGDVGPMAMQWIDLLHEAGQGWWQSLPLGPTGYGNSPYQPLSSFAGNWLLISPDWLIEDGLLLRSDYDASWCSAARVDFDKAISFKQALLERAWSNFRAARMPKLQAAFEGFCREQCDWLDDYALFRALKARHGGACYLDWPTELAQRQPAALARARRELANEMEESRFAQFLLYRQGARLREHAHDRGIRLIGDLPFFVSPDSSDVWAHPQLFLLDEQYRPAFVAGVPPDYFSPTGQLWGNPVYDWDAHRRTGYRWYIDRLLSLLAHVDAVRLDHFRGFAAAWHVPAAADSALGGHWAPGPGADLFHAIEAGLGALPFIVEDLGTITPDVCALRDAFHLPGTRVLQFAFDGQPANPYLPENFTPNTVVYTGTHDNAPSREWYQELPEEQRRILWRYLKTPPGESDDVAWSLIRLAWSSMAALALAPLQDLLGLGAEARMNVPGRSDGNWAWRCPAELLTGAYLQSLAELTDRTNRRTTPSSFVELKS
jgi:4-alpha-glucanotransferase